MKRLAGLLLPSVLILSGCVTNIDDCDPTTGDVSIITKFNCKYSGTYDKRVEMKQAVLANEQQLNSQFKAIYDAIEQEKRQSNATVAQKRASQKKLNQSVQNLLGELKQKTAGQSDIQKQISDIENKMKSSANNPDASVMQKQLELESLRNQVLDLQSDLGL